MVHVLIYVYQMVYLVYVYQMVYLVYIWYTIFTYTKWYLWPQPCMVQLEQQRGPPNLKSSWLGRPARARASVILIMNHDSARDRDRGLYNGPRARWGGDGPVLWRSGTVQLEQQRGPPSLKSSWLGWPARARASVSLIMVPPWTVTADCIMARGPDGPVLRRSGPVQQPEQRGPPSLI